MLVGLANIKYVERHKVVDILENKLKNYIARWEHIADFKKHVSIEKDKEKLNEFIGGYVSTKAEHTIKWLEELIKRIQCGDI